MRRLALEIENKYMRGPREIVGNNNAAEFEATDKLNLFATDLKRRLWGKFLARDHHCLHLF